MTGSRETDGNRTLAYSWEQRYRNGQTGWDRGESSPALHHWLDSGSLEPGRVLVPGCGHGHEIAALVRFGCRVTAVDIAETPVQRLREALAGEGLEADVVQADLLDWEPARRFEAIYEQTCLCALQRETWGLYARRLHDWLVPGGLLLALFILKSSVGRPSGCGSRGVWQGMTRRNSRSIATSYNAARRRARRALEVVAVFTR